MTEEKSSRSKHWLLFAISTIVFVAMCIWVPQWLWVPLPFVCTYAVQAFDVM